MSTTHPDHYAQCAIEPIDYITANNLPFPEACAIKYITRHRLKNGAEDIRKAIWYLNYILRTEYRTERIAFDQETDNTTTSSHQNTTQS